MKSIKPGRSHSAFGAVVGIFIALFGVIWTVAAIGIGAPWFFGVFGIGFVAVAIFQVVRNLHNAYGENRYSDFDIVDSEEEPDPYHIKYGPKEEASAPMHTTSESRYCPYCGKVVSDDFIYCNHCGRKLP